MTRERTGRIKLAEQEKRKRTKGGVFEKERESRERASEIESSESEIEGKWSLVGDRRISATTDEPLLFTVGSSPELSSGFVSVWVRLGGRSPEDLNS